MTSFKIKKSTLRGTLRVPPSKSQTLRALLFAALAEGGSTIFDPLFSPDLLAMAGACRMIGAKVEIREERIEVEGTGGRFLGEGTLYAGSSGIVLRFVAALAAVFGKKVRFEKEPSLERRPMRPLEEALKQLGQSEINVRGEDSQFVSALLIALSFGSAPTTLLVQNPGERPWVDLTLDWLERLGAAVVNHGYEQYEIPGGLAYPGFVYRVPGDLSSAAFPIVAALATGSELLLRNIDLTDPQGDKKIIGSLCEMGAKVQVDPEAKMLKVLKSSLKGAELAVNDMIDALPALAVAACFAEGKSSLTGASVARTKECDRLAAAAAELKKMGAKIEENEEGLTIEGGPLHGARVASHEDHRMALSLSVAGMGAEGETIVKGVECAAKTYSTFKEDFAGLGAIIEEI